MRPARRVRRARRWLFATSERQQLQDLQRASSGAARRGRRPVAVAATPAPVRRYRYYDLVLAGFVTVLLCSNLIGTAKVSEIHLPFELPIVGPMLVFGVGNIFFPISYIFGDVLTEVYGYARARRVLWAG